ncbi:MAG TPA: PfkB family carbohydrate kinase [Pirellulaceae bacterium]|nr:PfkB family carbohydrate kinase [Pirellulaceae bacterium]
MTTQERLENVLRSLPRMTIGLVGDLFLDRYLECVPGSYEPSIETGLEAFQIERVRNAAGALGTVMNNLAALGAGLLVPVSAIGDDGHGYDLLKEIRKLPVDPAHILCLPERLTPTYTKPMKLDSSGTRQELNRLDVRTREPLSDAATAELCRRVETVFQSSDGLIVLDQLVAENQGVVNSAVRATLSELAGQHPQKLIYIDSRQFLGKFDFGTLKGNQAEILQACDERETGDAAVVRSLQRLSQKTGHAAFCTIGERGILVAHPASEPQLVPGYPASGPIDIVGAGDAATSGIVSALLAGASELEAATLGNLVASITVQQLGTTGTATPDQVSARWREACGKRV